MRHCGDRWHRGPYGSFMKRSIAKQNVAKRNQACHNQAKHGTAKRSLEHSRGVPFEKVVDSTAQGLREAQPEFLGKRLERCPLGVAEKN